MTAATLDSIRRALALHDPELAPPVDDPRQHAAVALVLLQAEASLELLFIERAHREGDHWSGDMAFPGGRRQSDDASVEATARREAQEELGLELGPPIGRLADYDARARRRPWTLVVSPFVYAVERRPVLAPNAEVNAALWIPLPALLAPAARAEHTFLQGEARVRMPALRIDDRVIWGMTLRMLATFVAASGAGHLDA